MDSKHQKSEPNLKLNKLNLAIALALPMTFDVLAETYYVTDAIDKGRRDEFNSLSRAIQLANHNSGDDIIILKKDVSINRIMLGMIDSNITIKTDGPRRTVDGNNKFRPLFIKSGIVVIKDINIKNGLAQGGNSLKGGLGAGMGGGVFIYGGEVTLESVHISGSNALAGVVQSNNTGGSGGGLYGRGFGGGGGLVRNGRFSSEGLGAGYTDINDTRFGSGGISTPGSLNPDGGFGGGGATDERLLSQPPGHGGFGGGGGYGMRSNGGFGGFGAGGGNVSSINYLAGPPGYAAAGQASAGMGGGLFIRAGSVNLIDVTFENNQANAINGGKGLGGGLFVLHTTSNSNDNQRGMPDTLAEVNVCGVEYKNNDASDDDNTNLNNNDVFDLANIIQTTNNCEAEISVRGNDINIINGDSSPSMSDGTLFENSIINSSNDTQTFNIFNWGGTDLNLSGTPVVNITGENANNFIVSSQPNSVISPNLSSSFEISFNPVTIGYKSATIDIQNSDANESSFTFAIQALVEDRNIDIFGNGLPIEDKDKLPSVDDGTYFNTANSTQTFEIQNTGIEPLELLPVPIQILGSDASSFSVSSQPPTSIPGVTTATFDITFNPMDAGFKGAVIDIQNNDLDEGDYQFEILGGDEPGIHVTSVLDDGTGLIENSLSWAILQANMTPGQDIIFLSSDITITGVMKRLIDSDVILKSRGTTRTINGSNSFRPLFIKSGQVMIENIIIENSKAKGGSPGGAGMGGSLFIYDGDVTLDTVSIIDSQAKTVSPQFFTGGGGGGMFGSSYRQSRGGGGLFGSTVEYLINAGGYGGYGNYQTPSNRHFGKGGDYGYYYASYGGGFGAGSGETYFYYSGVGADGGFGGGSGNASLDPDGRGGFGGGSRDENPGYGATRLGAGMGGGIFIRTGNLNLKNVQLINSKATAEEGAKGLGGGIFILHSTTNPNGNNQGMPESLATVTACNLYFENNFASAQMGMANNDHDVFDLADRLTNEGICFEDHLIFSNGFESKD